MPPLIWNIAGGGPQVHTPPANMQLQPVNSKSWMWEIDWRRSAAAANMVQNMSGARNTTTYVQNVLIEQNTTTYQNSGGGMLQNKTTDNAFFGASSSIPWQMWDPIALWLFCAGLNLLAAAVLAAMVLQRNDASFACRSVYALVFMFLLTSVSYLLMAFGVGHLQEVYAVRVYDGITDLPGTLLWHAVVPPVVWLRHVSWAFTSAIQLHLLLCIASNDQTLRTSSRSRYVPYEMRFYVISINSIMHIAGLVGTVAPPNELSKWLYWVFACAMFAMLINQLTDKHGLISSLAKKNHVLQEYRSLVRVTLPVWAMYPVLWAVGDGSRTIHWEIKELVYVFLEVTAKLSFALVFILSSARSIVPQSCQAMFDWLVGPQESKVKKTHSRREKKQVHNSLGAQAHTVHNKSKRHEDARVPKF